MNTTGTFTCKDMMELEEMKGCEILAGEMALNQPIHRVIVAGNQELPGITESGDVILTAAFRFRNDLSDLRDFLYQLERAGAVCLGLKIRRYMGDVPQEILELADQLNILLIKIPINCIFSSVSLSVTEALLARQARDMQDAQDRMEMFLDIVNKSPGLQELLNAMEKLMKNPVVLLDANNEMMMSPRASQLFRELGERSVSLIRNYAERHVREIDYAGSTLPILTYPLDEEAVSHVIVFGFDSPITFPDTISLRRLSRILSVEVQNATVINKIKRNYKNQFVRGWLRGRYKTELDLILGAENADCHPDLGQQYRVAIIRLPEELTQEENTEKGVSQVRRMIKKLEKNVLFTFHENRLYMVLETHTDDPETEYRPLIAHLEENLSIPDLHICISGKRDPLHLSEAYNEVNKVLQISNQCEIRDRIVTREKLGIYSILALLPFESPDVSAFCDRYLKPLEEYDRTHHGELLETLWVYLEQNHNARAAADVLFTHYNTMIYRLKRIEEILQMDIDNVENSLALHIALRIRDMRSEDIRTGSTAESESGGPRQ